MRIIINRLILVSSRDFVITKKSKYHFTRMNMGQGIVNCGHLRIFVIFAKKNAFSPQNLLNSPQIWAKWILHIIDQFSLRFYLNYSKLKLYLKDASNIKRIPTIHLKILSKQFCWSPHLVNVHHSFRLSLFVSISACEWINAKR